MSTTSNGHGAIEIKDGRAYARRGGDPIGNLPLPLTPDDAKLMAWACWSPYLTHPTRLGLTGSLTISRLVAPHYELKICEECAGDGDVIWDINDGGPLVVCTKCEGFGWTFHPIEAAKGRPCLCSGCPSAAVAGGDYCQTCRGASRDSHPG